jgi:hypothetical protein
VKAAARRIFLTENDENQERVSQQGSITRSSFSDKKKTPMMMKISRNTLPLQPNEHSTDI